MESFRTTEISPMLYQKLAGRFIRSRSLHCPQPAPPLSVATREADSLPLHIDTCRVDVTLHSRELSRVTMQMRRYVLSIKKTNFNCSLFYLYSVELRHRGRRERPEESHWQSCPICALSTPQLSHASRLFLRRRGNLLKAAKYQTKEAKNQHGNPLHAGQ